MGLHMSQDGSRIHTDDVPQADCPACKRQRRSLSEVPAPSGARFAPIGRARLHWEEAEAIRRALAAGRHAGVDLAGATVYVDEHDYRFEGWRSFTETPHVRGFVDHDRPDTLAVRVGSGLSRRDIALAVLHEVRHVAQLAVAPATAADHDAAEADARAFAAEALAALAATDRWFAAP